MSGYTRQSNTEIIPSNTVKSAPVNAEFDELKNAFAFDATGNTGHKHDGSSDEGSYVPLIADLDGNNKVEVDTNNNRLSFSVEVSSSSVAQFYAEDGVIVPATTNDVDLGSSSKKFKDLHLAGTGNIPTLSNTTSATFSGTVTISGTVEDDVDMNGNTHKNLKAPEDDNDAARLIDVENIAGSATAAAASAASAAASLDEFTDLYLGAKASEPSTDNDGDPLQTGAIYWNTTLGSFFVYTGSVWSPAVFDTADALFATNNLSDLDDTPTARSNLGLGSMATQNSGSVSITGGSVSGITDLAVTDGGTGASTASGARTNLGLGTIATQDADDVTITGYVDSSNIRRFAIWIGA